MHISLYLPVCVPFPHFASFLHSVSPFCSELHRFSIHELLSRALSRPQVSADDLAVLSQRAVPFLEFRGLLGRKQPLLCASCHGAPGAYQGENMNMLCFRLFSLYLFIYLYNFNKNEDTFGEWLYQVQRCRYF